MADLSRRSLFGAVAALVGAAAIGSEAQPPRFVAGRAPDEVPATLHKCDNVLNRRAMADPKFRRALAEAEPVEIYINSRMVDAILRSSRRRVLS